MPGWSPEPPGYVTSLPRGRSTSAGQGTSASSSHRRPRSKASSDSRIPGARCDHHRAGRCSTMLRYRVGSSAGDRTIMDPHDARIGVASGREATGSNWSQIPVRSTPAASRSCRASRTSTSATGWFDQVSMHHSSASSRMLRSIHVPARIRAPQTTDALGLWPRARCRHATACMGFSINRFARWWHARDLHDRGAVSEDSITSTSPMLEGGTSSSHAGSSRWPRRSQRRADSLDGDAIQADRGSMASARSAQVASPPVCSNACRHPRPCNRVHRIES